MNDTQESLRDRQVTLERALRALRGIRARYDLEGEVSLHAGIHRLHLVLDRADVAWITATIDALERATGAVPSEFAAPTVGAGPEAYR
jgi:hypothetical protein